MADTGPSAGFLERVFGPKRKKRTEDINLPSAKEDKAEAEEYRKKKKSSSMNSNGKESIFSRAKAVKEKYNPFDAYVKAIGGKSGN